MINQTCYTPFILQRAEILKTAFITMPQSINWGLIAVFQGSNPEQAFLVACDTATKKRNRPEANTIHLRMLNETWFRIVEHELEFEEE